MLEVCLLMRCISVGAWSLVLCVRIWLELLLILGESLVLLGLTIARNLLLASILRCALAPLAQCIALLVEGLEVVRAACSNVVHAGRRLGHRPRSAGVLGARLYRLSGRLGGWRMRVLGSIQLCWKEARIASLISSEP